MKMEVGGLSLASVRSVWLLAFASISSSKASVAPQPPKKTNGISSQAGCGAGSPCAKALMFWYIIIVCRGAIIAYIVIGPCISILYKSAEQKIYMANPP